jgi:hypothetical protein
MGGTRDLPSGRYVPPGQINAPRVADRRNPPLAGGSLFAGNAVAVSHHTVVCKEGVIIS